MLRDRILSQDPRDALAQIGRTSLGRFTGKVVIVTGAASGIGKGAAKRFADEEATLVLGDLDGGALEALKGKLAGEPVETLAGDVSKNAGCEALGKLAVDKYGRVDVLVNNARVDHLGMVDEGGLDGFTKVIETDLYGVVQMTRAAVPHLRAAKGCIVNTSSISGLGGDWNHGFYCAAKGAVTNVTRAPAIDEARHGVRVNAVDPSLTSTALIAGMRQ